MSPEPKRRNAEKTKASILLAAQQLFAEQGFSQTGIRDIAARAGISSPLLMRYFGSKAGLFEAALIDAVRIETVLTPTKAGFGERLAMLFTDSEINITPPAIIALSVGHPDAQEIATRVVSEYVIQPVAEWLDGTDKVARATEIFMLATSFVMYSRQIPVIGKSEHKGRSVNEWLAGTVQAIVDAN
ncbi:TetR family transcriptional regulator [Halioxenophilus sp. WMMB6]|uniref:TetR family transcriptional regulator n=1 Tax=Halioxenophilus sp. WMMB6 TaxID=3073815 RepID=UPI00295EDBBF|nr:TetR family transcriptional regulator [Halioxenophilus sp. WMMB6]